MKRYFDQTTKKLKLSKKNFILICCIGLLSICANAQNNWTGAVDTDWDTPGNWSFGTVPTIADDVTIPSFAYVDVNVAASANSITIFNNATVDVNNNITFNTNITVFLDASFNWYSGIISGGFVYNSGNILLSTSSGKTLNNGVVLQNSNSLIFDTGAVTLNLSNNSILENTSIGTFDIRSSTGTGIYKSGLGGTVINSGTLIKSDGALYTINADYFSHLGETDVQVGTLRLASSNNTLNEVELNTSLGAVLDLTGTYDIFGFWTGVNLGSLDFKGTFNVAIGVTFNFFNNGIYHKTGTINGPGTIVNNGNCSFLTTSGKTFNAGLQFDNYGTFIMGTGAVTMNLSNSSLFTNKPGALLHFKSATTTGIYQSGSGGTLINEGEIRKTDGGDFSFNCVFENYNYINVLFGNFNLNGATGSKLVSGIYDVGLGNFLKINSAHELSGVLNGNILGSFEFRSTINIPVSLENNFAGNGIHWYTNTINGPGTITNTTNFSLLTTSGKIFNSALNFINNGYFFMEMSAVTLNISNNSLLINASSGLMEIQSTTTTGIYQTGSGGTLQNNGSILKTVGGNFNISCLFINDSTIEIQSGKLGLTSSPTHQLIGGVYNVGIGATFELFGNVNMSGDINGLISGEFLLKNNIIIDAITSNYTTGNGMFWQTGTISGTGTLNNYTTFTMVTSSAKILNSATTIENFADLIVEEGGVTLNISNLSKLINDVAGTFTIKATTMTGLYGTGSGGFVENHGTMLKTIGGQFNISAEFMNDGDLVITDGELEINGSPQHELNGGSYNISAGAIFELNGNNLLSGSLFGSNLGEFNFKSNIHVTGTAELNIIGNGVTWLTGTILGAGELINNDFFDMATSSAKILSSSTGIVNNGSMTLQSGAITLNMSNGAYVINESSGSIEIWSTSVTGIYQTGSGGTITNEGSLRKLDIGVFSISSAFLNNGIIEVNAGELRMFSSTSLTNGLNGLIKGFGEISIPTPANYVNQGTYTPGGSVGTLLFDGDYESDVTAVMEFELDGLTPDTEHDVLEIEGNAAFDGDLIVHLGFAPAVGDQFVVATVTGTITSCTLPASVTAYYLNSFYTFDVICNPNDITLERSCILPVGCTNDWACNYDALAMCEDESCILLDGDADHSGAVDILDLIAVSSNFGCSSNCPIGDANYDFEVNILDLVTVSSNFGAVCP